LSQGSSFSGLIGFSVESETLVMPLAET